MFLCMVCMNIACQTASQNVLAFKSTTDFPISDNKVNFISYHYVFISAFQKLLYILFCALFGIDPVTAACSYLFIHHTRLILGYTEIYNDNNGIRIDRRAHSHEMHINSIIQFCVHMIHQF